MAFSIYLSDKSHAIGTLEGQQRFISVDKSPAQFSRDSDFADTQIDKVLPQMAKRARAG